MKNTGLLPSSSGDQKGCAESLRKDPGPAPSSGPVSSHRPWSPSALPCDGTPRTGPGGASHGSLPHFHCRAGKGDLSGSQPGGWAPSSTWFSSFSGGQGPGPWEGSSRSSAGTFQPPAKNGVMAEEPRLRWPSACPSPETHAPGSLRPRAPNWQALGRWRGQPYACPGSE